MQLELGLRWRVVSLGQVRQRAGWQLQLELGLRRWLLSLGQVRGGRWGLLIELGLRPRRKLSLGQVCDGTGLVLQLELGLRRRLLSLGQVRIELGAYSGRPPTAARRLRS